MQQNKDRIDSEFHQNDHHILSIFIAKGVFLKHYQTGL